MYRVECHGLPQYEFRGSDLDRLVERVVIPMLKSWMTHPVVRVPMATPVGPIPG